jgi:putative salt-induced outer membrane protein YdiY
MKLLKVHSFPLGRRIRAGALGVVALALGVAAAPGDETAEAAGLRGSVNLGATVTRGNSEAFQAHVGMNLDGDRRGVGSLRSGIEARYGEEVTDGERRTSVENASLFANAKGTLSPRTFAAANAAALYDDLAGVDYRAVLGPAAGFYALQSATLALSLEGGVSYLWEKTTEQRADYWVFRAAERLEWKAGAGARLWQSAEYLPKARDFSDWLLQLELGAEAAVNTRLSLRTVLTGKIDNAPPEERRKRDVSLVAGARVKL